MRYAAFDPTVRDTELNEYLNISTGKPETIRYYGCYRVKETFLTPDGQIILLGHDPHGVDKFVTGIYRQSVGRYFSNGNDAREDFVERIADSFGLKAVPKSSVVVSDEDRRITGGELRKLAAAAAVVDEDPTECDEATLQALVDAATTVVDRVEGLGIKTLYRDVQPTTEQAPALGRV